MLKEQWQDIEFIFILQSILYDRPTWLKKKKKTQHKKVPPALLCKWIRRHLKRPPPYHVLIIYIGLSLVDTIRERPTPVWLSICTSSLVLPRSFCSVWCGSDTDGVLAWKSLIIVTLPLRFVESANVRSRAGRRAWGGARKR